MYSDYNDRKSPNKTTVKVHEWSEFIQSGDWLDISDFDKKLEFGRNRVRMNDDFKDRPVYIFFIVDDDHEITLEFWGERIETDDEFDYRQKDLAMYEQARKGTELANLRAKASEYGFDLVKKEECF